MKRMIVAALVVLAVAGCGGRDPVNASVVLTPELACPGATVEHHPGGSAECYWQCADLESEWHSCRSTLVWVFLKQDETGWHITGDLCGPPC